MIRKGRMEKRKGGREEGREGGRKRRRMKGWEGRREEGGGRREGLTLYIHMVRGFQSVTKNHCRMSNLVL